MTDGGGVLVGFSFVAVSAATVGFAVGTTVCSPAWLLLALAILLAGTGGASAIVAITRYRQGRGGP